jgi:hypothetical protein
MVVAPIITITGVVAIVLVGVDADAFAFTESFENFLSFDTFSGSFSDHLWQENVFAFIAVALTRFEPSKVADRAVSYVLDAFDAFVMFALVADRIEAEGGVGITTDQVEYPLLFIATLVKGLFPDTKKGWEAVKLVLFAFSDKVSNDEAVALLDAQYEAVFLNATSAKLLASRVVVFVKLSESSTSVKRFLLEKEEAVHFWYTVFTHFFSSQRKF